MPAISDSGRATMRDVAALAGVSLKTVSRVINDEPMVSADLVERVREAARRLDYQPNLTASSLRRGFGRSGTVGLLVEDVANPFSASVHRAIEEVARARGAVVLAGSVDSDPARERELVAAFGGRRVDGLIIVPAGTDQSYLEAERRAGTALVFVDRPPRSFDSDVVLSDNRTGSADATAHLIAHGHRRIAFLGDNAAVYTAAERFAGYTDALGDAGIPFDPVLVRRGLIGADAAERAQRDLMTGDSPPTAVFTGQNLITLGAVAALRRLGLHRSVALVGFDDLPFGGLADPGITVVAQDTTWIGTMAAQLLFRRIDGDVRAPQRFDLPTRLIVRGSGEIRPVVLTGLGRSTAR